MRSSIRANTFDTDTLAWSRDRSSRKNPTTPETTRATATATNPRIGVSNCTRNQATMSSPNLSTV